MSLIRLILFISFIISIKTTSFAFYIKSFFLEIKKLRYEEYFQNPYRILGLSPWTSMKNIKKKYNELVKKKHPDRSNTGNREEFELIQKAFEKIKKDRKENEEIEDDINFSYVIKSTISKLINIEIIFLALYTAAYIIYKFQSMIYVPLFYMIISFTIIDNLFVHYFHEELIEYIVCLIIGFFLYSQHKKIFKKDKKKKKRNIN